MNELLDKILDSGLVYDSKGKSRPLHSNTSRAQCEFLQKIIRQTGATRCLEVGFAYGVSTLAICEAISGKPGASIHTIDPFQEVSWENVGVTNINRAGFGNLLIHHEAPSQHVLPQLAQDGCRFDFAYVDTTKVFDYVLTDAFYIVQMLDIGGVVVFDDCVWPGVRKVVRYLSAWPHLEIFDAFGRTSSGKTRRIASTIARSIPAAGKFFRGEVLRTDESLGIAAECIAFRKKAEDDRPWNWSVVP